MRRPVLAAAIGGCLATSLPAAPPSDIAPKPFGRPELIMKLACIATPRTVGAETAVLVQVRNDGIAVVTAGTAILYEYGGTTALRALGENLASGRTSTGFSVPGRFSTCTATVARPLKIGREPPLIPKPNPARLSCALYVIEDRYMSGVLTSDGPMTIKAGTELRVWFTDGVGRQGVDIKLQTALKTGETFSDPLLVYERTDFTACSVEFR